MLRKLYVHYRISFPVALNKQREQQVQNKENENQRTKWKETHKTTQLSKFHITMGDSKTGNRYLELHVNYANKVPCIKIALQITKRMLISG
jgi:hypothetical protein